VVCARSLQAGRLMAGEVMTFPYRPVRGIDEVQSRLSAKAALSHLT
jgi:hypothetical protein